MSAKEICREVFQLIVRLVGLWFLYRSLMLLPDFITLFVKLLGNAPTVSAFGISLVKLTWISALAYWFLIGAPQLMHIAYRKKQGSEE